MNVVAPYVQVFVFMATKAIPFIVLCTLILVAIVAIPIGAFYGLMYLLDKWEDKRCG